MKIRFGLSALAAAAALAAVPASAAVLVPGASNVAFTAFNLASQGTLLGSTGDQAVSNLAYSGVMRSAVYRNTGGGLDFYYQITRTGAGSLLDEGITELSAASFANWAVTAFVATGDVDGVGNFIARTTVGTLANADRSPGLGGSVFADFNDDFPVTGLLTSATYIFRTNASAYTTGTFASLGGGGSSNIQAFRPIGVSVPEPATWALMMLGFAAIGASLRKAKAGKKSPRVRFAI